MDLPQQTIINRLNALAQVVRDGEAGYRNAADGVRDEQLRLAFAACAEERHAMLDDLCSAIRDNGGEPNLDAPVTAAMYRGWFNVDESLSPDDPYAMLIECEVGEDLTRKRLSEALEQEMPSEIKPVIERQIQRARLTHDRIRGLREAMRH
jgi:uncharacterized protein (TIGR02284 family)